MAPLLALLVALQQPLASSSPPGGDTTGYWQQRADYRIIATLDDARGVLTAAGTLTYVNASPDTLRELRVHQYLNAFRPVSRWSATDAREGRVRFQHLAPEDQAYERFTTAPRVNGVPVQVRYPFAPDSTVAHFDLPQPLAPRDSIIVRFAWEARPSTLPRRQGRRGRHVDFAQWFPKVAVYDRRGWNDNPLVPAGEFYGEFGTFDVTLVVRDDQVIGATGVPVEGDPGWVRARRAGSVHLGANAYDDVPPAIGIDVPPGYRRVRFYARGVHHFGWSANPEYRYEGGVLVRPRTAPSRIPAWDTVGIHVLYRPGDEREWGNLAVVERTRIALAWLERIYGTYGYPQITNLHRIEPGGTEFPMLMMNGSPSQGLALHELGHVFSYGLLANNEWRSGWMDEGLTSYQTSWAQGLTAHDRAVPDTTLPVPAAHPAAIRGYRARAVRPTSLGATQIEQFRLDLLGRAEPIGTTAHEFRESGIYTAMVYTRAERMYSMLRDILGTNGMEAFLEDYYARWAFRHVDEPAMRGSASRVAESDLGWFFDQWVHRTGLVDYALRDVGMRQEGGQWVTRARVVRQGEYRHPMPVGVRTSAGWTTLRASHDSLEQTLEIRTNETPLEVRIDPLRVTEDWDRRNDGWRASDRRWVFDWPFLDQRDRDRTIVALSPVAWYSAPGGVTLAARVRTNYQGWLSKQMLGIGWMTRDPGLQPTEGDALTDRVELLQRLQLWWSSENPGYGSQRPAVGLRASLGALDGIARVDLRRSWDRSRFHTAPARVDRIIELSAMAVAPYEPQMTDPARWEDVALAELGVGYRMRGALPIADTASARLNAGIGGIWSGGGNEVGRSYSRMEAEASASRGGQRGSRRTRARVFAGYAEGAPAQRQLRLSSLDPVETYERHFLRPRGGVLSHPDAHYVQLGGGGIRGLDPRVATDRIVALNLEHGARLGRRALPSGPMELWAHAFADGYAAGREVGSGATAGAGLALRGALWDRPLSMRVELPLFMTAPQFAIGDTRARQDRVALRWTWTLGDLW